MDLWIPLLFGFSATLLVWLGWLAYGNLPPGPEDEIMPRLFAVVKWPMRVLSHFVVQPLIPPDWLGPLQKNMRRIGLEYVIQASDFVAAQCVWAIMAAALAAIFTTLIHLTAFQGGVITLFFILGFIYPRIWLRDQVEVIRREVRRTLTFYLDILMLCMDAGLNIQAGLAQAVERGPEGVLRNELARVLRDIRAGTTRADALRNLADRLEDQGIQSFVNAVIQAERMGMNLGSILASQAEQRRAERFLRAEKLALQAPVKMLLPLILFIFPCTFIVLGFPLAMKFMHAGF